MTCPKYDFHTHTAHVGCANQTMTVPAILARAAQLGVTALGISDHLDKPEKVPAHRAILADLKAADTPIDLYMGAELNYLALDGGFFADEAMKEELGIQYVNAGPHHWWIESYDFDKLVAIHHRHHLKTCAHPMVDAIVHPYFFHTVRWGEWGWPHFDADCVRRIPRSFAVELGQAARDSGTAVEINGTSALAFMGGQQKNEWEQAYFEFMSIVAEQGATFSTGSDAHDVSNLENVATCWAFLERLGIGEDRVFRPDCTPINRGR